MYRTFISAFQMLNILFQALYTLALPIGIGALISYLTTRHLGAPRFIWAILLTLGTLMGLYSMIKYVLSALRAMERLEKERDEREKQKAEQEESRKRWVKENDTE